MKNQLLRRRVRSSGSRQRGVVLLFSLIALAIMLIVAVALVRSFNNSLFTAGNIGFKRDLQNQSEVAVATVLTRFRTSGPLSTPAQRATDKPTLNYSATMLPTNAEGIPTALNASTYPTSWTAGELPGGTGVTVRYLVDRLCAISGDETTIGASTNCRLADYAVPLGSGLDNLRSADKTVNGAPGAAPQGVLYRVSIRVSGPRNTQSFFQSTFTAPSF